MDALLRQGVALVLLLDLVIHTIPDVDAHPAHPDHGQLTLTNELCPFLVALQLERATILVIVVLFGKPILHRLNARHLHPQFDYDPIHAVQPP